MYLEVVQLGHSLEDSSRTNKFRHVLYITLYKHYDCSLDVSELYRFRQNYDLTAISVSIKYSEYVTTLSVSLLIAMTAVRRLNVTQIVNLSSVQTVMIAALNLAVTWQETQRN